MDGGWRRLGPVAAFTELRHEFDRALFVLAAGDLIASFGFSLVFPFLTIYLTQSLGASAAEAGAVLGLYSLTSIASNAAGGWLADRYGRKAVMVGSITLTAGVVALMGQVTDLRAVAALTVALGLVDPAFVPAARAAVSDVVPEARRARAYGLLGVAASIGWIAGPSIGAGLSALGYPFLFAISGFILAGYTVLLVVALPETLPADARVAHAAVDPIEAGPPPESAGSAILAIADSARASAAHPTPQAPPPHARSLFAAFLPITMLIHAATFQWVATLPIHAARDLGVTTTSWGLIFAVNGIMIVFFQLRISTLTERWSKPRTMALGMVAYGLGYVAVVAAVPTVAVFALFAVVALVTLGEMLVFPVEPAFVSDLSPIDRRGRYQGVAGAAAGLGSAIGPPLGGLSLDLLPGPATWLAVAVASVACAAGLVWLAARDVAWRPRAGPAR